MSINGIAGEAAQAERRRRQHEVTLAYLAGHITREECDLLCWRASAGLPV
jgi:hypothetical protein